MQFKLILALLLNLLKELPKLLPKRKPVETDNFKKLFEAANFKLAVIDKSAAVVEINPYFLAHLGMTREQMIGQKILRFVHPDDVNIAGDMLDALRDGAQVRRVKFRIRNSDWTYLKTEWTATGNGIIVALIHSLEN